MLVVLLAKAPNALYAKFQFSSPQISGMGKAARISTYWRDSLSRKYCWDSGESTAKMLSLKYRRFSGGVGKAVQILPPSTGGLRTVAEVFPLKYILAEDHGAEVSHQGTGGIQKHGPTVFPQVLTGLRKDSGVLSQFFPPSTGEF